MIDFISSIFLIIGYILTGKKNRWGWLLASVGNLGYIYISFTLSLYGMLALSSVMMIISIINFKKWNNEKLNSNS